MILAIAIIFAPGAVALSCVRESTLASISAFLFGVSSIPRDRGWALVIAQIKKYEFKKVVYK